jgi:hypothetical protein
VALPHNPLKMKYHPLKKITLLVLCSAFSFLVHAQNANKPTIFQNYPSEIGCSTTQLDALFTQAENTPVLLTLTNGFTIIGTLSSVIAKSPNVKSLIVKVSNFSNIVFSVSKISDIYTPEKYVGRLMNAQQYADYYELMQDNGIYKLKKQLSENVFAPCKQ